ncbi:MAG: DUF4864 domain-containing protein [Panacagrimonas sp.]
MNLARSLSFVTVMLMAVFTAQIRAQPAAVSPSPELEPQQVVEAMLQALRKNSDQGIAELYRFSSPKNREVTGSLEQFTVMIREGFPDMLGHRSARQGPPLLDGDRAMIPIELETQDAQQVRYIVLLSRQALPECSGCWMTDAVFNPDLEDPAQTQPRDYPT